MSEETADHTDSRSLFSYHRIFELPANGYLTSFYSGSVDDGRLQEMLNYIQEYGVDVRPERVFTLDQIPEAHAYLESSRSFGKTDAVDRISQ